MYLHQSASLHAGLGTNLFPPFNMFLPGHFAQGLKHGLTTWLHIGMFGDHECLRLPGTGWNLLEFKMPTESLKFTGPCEEQQMLSGTALWLEKNDPTWSNQRLSPVKTKQNIQNSDCFAALFGFIWFSNVFNPSCQIQWSIIFQWVCIEGLGCTIALGHCRVPQLSVPTLDHFGVLRCLRKPQKCLLTW